MLQAIQSWRARHPDLYEFIMFNILANIATITNFLVLLLGNTLLFRAFAQIPFVWGPFEYTLDNGGLCGFLSFLLRVIGMIPMDVTSMYLGYTGVAFFPYLLATVAGALPKIIAITLMGDSITRPGSPAFIYSAIFTVVLSLLSVLVFLLFKKHNSNSGDNR